MNSIFSHLLAYHLPGLAINRKMTHEFSMERLGPKVIWATTGNLLLLLNNRSSCHFLRIPCLDLFWSGTLLSLLILRWRWFLYLRLFFRDWFLSLRTLDSRLFGRTFLHNFLLLQRRFFRRISQILGLWINLKSRIKNMEVARLLFDIDFVLHQEFF